MIRRVAALGVVLWLLGFALFVVLIPGPADDRPTDGIVVLTGGAGRLARGVALLAHRRARRLLVSGVDRLVRPGELAAEVGAPAALFACCVDLGQDAVDTRTNADETARWTRDHRYRSIRLVTTDWHMPRARFELARLLRPTGVTIVADGVPSQPGLEALFTEYNKYLLRRLAVPVGL